MGYGKEWNLKFVEDSMEYLGMEYSNIRMLELGNQSIRIGSFLVAKQYFESLGIEHVSIDWNGKNGALKIDLNKLIINTDITARQFDVITNMGTTEHVSNQYSCFRNLHNCCRKGGIMIHAVPVYDFPVPHGLWHYNPKFFDEISFSNAYEIFNRDTLIYRGNQICARALVKKEDGGFQPQEQFEQIKAKYLRDVSAHFKDGET